MRSGSGHGLAIVRDIIVNKHNGKVSFESTEGAGVDFKVELPLTKSA